MTTEQTLRESYGRRLIAALVSSMSASAIEIGVASVMPVIPVSIAVLFLLAGIGIHIAGMVIAHRADAEAMTIPHRWHQPFTIVCWIALIGLAVLTTFSFIHSSR